jgi:hypothetical protein
MFSFTHRISIETEKIVNNKCLSLDVIKKKKKLIFRSHNVTEINNSLKDRQESE